VGYSTPDEHAALIGRIARALGSLRMSNQRFWSSGSPERTTS